MSEQPTLPPSPSKTTPLSAEAPTLAPGSAVESERSHEAALPAGAPDRLGDYELLEEIARGGMGVVFRARQAGLGRTVAVKMILGGRLADAEAIQRFRTEAEAAAALDHPGIVPVYEVGECDGRHYFSMAYVDGESLADRLARGPLANREAAWIALRIAQAAAYAHGQGVIHRDLKPANVLLSRTGGAAPAGGSGDTTRGPREEPKITDFGLARRVEGESGLTASGQILGTPSYMAPEQAAGKLSSVGPRSDVYAIGAILYHMLTGRPPFQSASVTETLVDVLERDLAPPRLLDGRIDRDLEAICLACLEKAPARRYPSAAALADELARYLEGESISRASINLLDRVARTLSRSKHDAAFGPWSAILLWFSPIVLLAEAGIYLHARGGPPYEHGVAAAVRLAQFALMGLVMVRWRRAWQGAGGAVERQMLSLWVGFLTASLLSAAAAWRLSPAGQPVEVLVVYPYLAILSGFAWFLLGGTHWGWCYAFGLAFFVLSLALPWRLDLAPLAFGALWGGALAAIGLRLRRLARGAASS